MTLDEFNARWKDPASAGMAVRLLGIRGWHLDEGERGANDVGIFDDAIFRCIDDEVTEWRASTDPGRYYIRHPMNPGGCAQLQPGLWWFRIGEHRGRPALVQDDEFVVNRLDEQGARRGVDRGWFGINLHSGGAEYEVGRWSAGCQVILSPEGAWGATWQRFFQPIQRADAGGIPYQLDAL